MAFMYGIKNAYRPTKLIDSAYGWSSRPQYNRADVPTALMERPANLTSDQFLQQFAYEWFQSSQLSDAAAAEAGTPNGVNWSGITSSTLSNPPFASGAAGRLHPLLRDSQTGKPARILRGYIRRSEFIAGDAMTRARLYFMYNPETITRDYVSYMNQDALDPFNTVYQSGNLVAPPSIMNFSFSLFFDRQEEAVQVDHPGVFVDYQFFDLVVRNVVPSNPNQTGNTLPDNGVMMVNPRDITVIFSPQLSVQGRPTNASVSFEKFTHRMTPTRMTISLTMLVTYFGPVKDQVEYHKEEFQAEAQIPNGETVPDYGLSWDKNDSDSDSFLEQVSQAALGPLGTMIPGAAALGVVAGAGGTLLDSLSGGLNVKSLASQFANSKDGNASARAAALAWAVSHVNQGGPGDGPWTDYEGADSGAKRYNLPESADCSGLVTSAYIGIGMGSVMKWNSHPGTAVIMQLAQQNPKTQVFVELSKIDWKTELQTGDILIRNGHVAFFVGYDAGKLVIFDAAGKNLSPEVGQRSQAGIGKFTHLLRPLPYGSNTAASTTSLWGSIAGGVLSVMNIGGLF